MTAYLDQVMMLLAADSLAKASTPEPWSTSHTSNWVARAGGLPAYVQHVSHGIKESDPAMTESRAIQIAIGKIKDWARGLGNVDAGTRAASVKAMAEWEAKKASAHAHAGLPKSEELADEDFIHLALGLDEELSDDYELILSEERSKRGLDRETGELFMAIGDYIHFTWDPNEHPRGLLGRFTEALNNLHPGGVVSTPDNVQVHKDSLLGRFTVFNPHKPNLTPKSAATAEEAARIALGDSALAKHPKSLGGAESHGHIYSAQAPGKPVDKIGNVLEHGDRVDVVHPNSEPASGVVKEFHKGTANHRVSVQVGSQTKRYNVRSLQRQEPGMTPDRPQNRTPPPDQPVLRSDEPKVFGTSKTLALGEVPTVQQLEELGPGDELRLPDPNPGVVDWVITHRVGGDYHVGYPSGRGAVHDTPEEVLADGLLFPDAPPSPPEYGVPNTADFGVNALNDSDVNRALKLFGGAGLPNVDHSAQTMEFYTVAGHDAFFHKGSPVGPDAGAVEWGVASDFLPGGHLTAPTLEALAKEWRRLVEESKKIQ